ncbi:ribonuclease HII [Patescibacteria group bacterium]
MNLDLLKFENELWEKGIKHIAGVDEVGRGALAGPLVVAAVIMDREPLRKSDVSLEEFPEYADIKDSKLISPNKRKKLADFIRNVAFSFSIVEIPHTHIDGKGIVSATQVGFHKAVKSLDKSPHHVLTDSFSIKLWPYKNQTNIIRGDNKSISIAAASIIAKVYRDDLMVRLHEENKKYQVYGFDRHKGYGTKFHREMIFMHGRSDIHRKSFRVRV